MAWMRRRSLGRRGLAVTLAALLALGNAAIPAFPPKEMAQADVPPPVAWAPTNGPYGGFVRSLALSPAFATDRTLFAGTLREGVFLSSDGGASWQPASQGLTNTDVRSLALSPAFATDRTLFAGTRGGGVFRGAAAPSAAVPNSAPVVTAVPPGRVLYAHRAWTLRVATFSDDINDSHTGTIDWGDGTPAQPVVFNQELGRVVNGTHTFPRAGTFTVAITVTDNQGSSGTTSLQMVVRPHPRLRG